ncbi:MAG: hypothetical protein AB8G22_14525 [Saprospiraceae bacterium]
MIDNPLYRHPSMQLLRRAIAREQRMQLIAAMVLTLGGWVTVYFAFTKSQLFAALGIIATLIGIRLSFRYAQRQSVEESYLVRLLFHQPDKIVWVYGLVTQHQPFGFNTTKSGVLYFYLVNGDNISVSLTAQKLKQVSFFLNRLLPKAVFGYTKERAQQYEHDPKSLLR